MTDSEKKMPREQSGASDKGKTKPLGKWLVNTAPRAADIELPSRKSDRGDPLADIDFEE
jgi:hypothetical protein